MVGIYITEDCPNLTKQQVEKLMELDAKELYLRLHAYNLGDVREFELAPKTLSPKEKKEYEELFVLIGQMHKKVRDYVASKEFLDEIRSQEYAFQGKTNLKAAKNYQEGCIYNVDMDFMRMLVDYFYMNYELADSGNPQFDLAEAVKSYSSSRKVLRKIVIDNEVELMAGKKFKDIYLGEFKYARMPFEETKKIVEKGYHKLIKKLRLLEPESAPPQPGEN